MTPEEVVRAELAAWSSLDVDQILAYFADDATWLPAFKFPTYSGLKEIRQAVDGFLKPMTKADIEILNLAVAGNVVLTERVDRFIFHGKPLDAPGMGAFEVSGDKISAWRDYFVAEDT
jgi:limonene-1,2-epoxide hydrolase